VVERCGRELSSDASLHERTRMPSRSASQPGLFDEPQPWPTGLVYVQDFITPDEHDALTEAVRAQPFGQVKMHGVVARRRVVQLGWHYGFDKRRLAPGAPIPIFLDPLRTRVGELTGLDPAAFAEVLLTEYPPGATIGWHRDAPPFGIVVGVSLASACTFRFRRGEAGTREMLALDLAPRSAYVLDGPARSEWQHSIPPAKALRYSITFRTLR
jgi:DNA oxidative demethylase